MCMEDIRLGRTSGAIERTVDVNGVTAVAICQGNPKRTRLIVSGNTSTAMAISTDSQAPTTTKGLWLSAFNPIRILTVEEFGNLVTQPWFGYTAVGNDRMTVIEVNQEKE